MAEKAGKKAAHAQWNQTQIEHVQQISMKKGDQLLFQSTSVQNGPNGIYGP
jgi:hypothetical protein